MSRPLLGVVTFTVAVVLAVAAIGEVITRISGEDGRWSAGTPPVRDVTPEAGEAIFWGKGKCGTCHPVGRRGNAIRGPDQGEGGPLGLPIGARAVERARERMQATGRPYTPTDYLVESLLDPGAYVVAGYKNEMPPPMRPPIRLGPDQVRAVVLYLQSLGGQIDLAAITLPPEAEASAWAGTAAVAWSPYIPGDPQRGEHLFFDEKGNAGCGRCHVVRGRGGTVGPELTQVAGTRDPRFIVESILDPSKEIASGYEPVLVVTRSGRMLTGVVRKDDTSGLEVVDAQGEVHRIPAAEIRRTARQTTSLMPENFKEILTVEEFHDLLAFLLTLR